MIFGVILELVIGTLCIIMGLLIWIKKRVSLLHTYHYKNVKEKDIPAYARQMGIGLIVIGVGICATGLLNLFFDSALVILALIPGFAVGLVVMHKAQKRYNGSWF